MNRYRQRKAIGSREPTFSMKACRGVEFVFVAFERLSISISKEEAKREDLQEKEAETMQTCV